VVKNTKKYNIWYKKAAEKSAAIFFEKRLAKCETMCYNVTYNDVKTL